MPALVMNCLAPSITHSPSVEPGARADVAGVGAGLGLGQPEGAELAARAEVGQQSRLLLLGAEEVDRLRAERGVRAQRDRDRRVDPRQLLDRDRVRERVAARRRRPPRGTGSPSSPSSPILATISYGKRLRRGRAPPRPAPPRRSAKSRTVRWSSCGARRRGRSPCADVYRMSVRISNDHSKFDAYGLADGRPAPPDRRCASATTAASSEVVLGAARVFAERGYDQTSMQRARRGARASPPAASTTTSGARSSC